MHLMLEGTNYAQNYASIVGSSLAMGGTAVDEIQKKMQVNSACTSVTAQQYVTVETTHKLLLHAWLQCNLFSQFNYFGVNRCILYTTSMNLSPDSGVYVLCV